jgi:RNA polymerase sigma-70 factor (ECF subfamily)
MYILLKTIQQRIAEGEEKAFEELYRLFNKKLQHFAKALVRSKEIAEEVVEDVFVKLWCNRSSISTIENLNVYLYIAVKNKALNTLSHKAVNLVTAPFDFLEISLNQSSSDPYDLMITSEMMHLMHKAIEELPPRCKMIFKLIREDGLKYKEVAEILNISVNTIDVQMAIAVKKICAALQVQKPSKDSVHHFLKEKKL